MTRFGLVMATYFSSIAGIVSAFMHPAPRLLWNASASVPIGLYAVHPAQELRIGQTLVVRPPEPLARLMDERGYLSMGVPLIKRILALPGQTVCRTGHTITVDGATAGEALDRDRRGRPLPAWRQCRTLGADQVFLMNRQPADSFDGRYFGVLPTSTIVGTASPIWTEAGR